MLSDEDDVTEMHESSFSFNIERGTSQSSDSEIYKRRNELRRQELTTILWVILAKTVWSLITTFVFPAAVPVFVETIGSNDLHPEYDGWYRGGDIVRFVEPVGGLLFSFWIFHASGIFNYSARNVSFEILIAMLYIFGVSLYMQGGAFHSASNMFKHGLEIFLDDYLPKDSIDTTQEEQQREYMEDFYYWMRTVWQHIVSHYIYAIGAATSDVCIFIAYRNHTLEFRDASAKQHSNGRNEASSPLAAINLTSGGQSAMHTSASPPKSSDDKSASTIGTLVILNGIAYGLLLSAVAVNFPSGIIVALIYFPLYLMCVARYLSLAGDWETRKKVSWITIVASRPVLYVSVLGYLFGVFVVLVWIAATQSVKKRSDVM